jgi:cellobiose phosphorylase
MTVSTTSNASALAVRDSLQLLLREDPSLQLLLNEGCSIQDFASTTMTVAGDLDAKLALVESLAVKVSRTSPEAISQQFLTTDMKKFQTQGQRLLSSSRSVVATATRVETALSQQRVRLATAVTKLTHAIALQSVVKQLLKLHFESQKEFDLDDRRDLLKAAGTLPGCCGTRPAHPHF